jgi:hypothetical protein
MHSKGRVIMRERWRKSSHSGAENDCVELIVQQDATRIRDTKNRDGGTVTISVLGWTEFLDAAHNGEFTC